MASDQKGSTELQPGPSGMSNKRARSRSSSSSSSSSTSSSSSSSGQKRSHRHRHKKSKRSRRSARLMDKLFKEMGELRKHIAVGNDNNVCHDTNCFENNRCLENSNVAFPDNESILSEVSGDLYEVNNVNDAPCPDAESQDANSNLPFTFDIETKLKEPSVPKTPDFFLKMLLDVQRLGSAAWSEVRYSDTQKLYNHTPGFVDLESNEEVKMYDTSRHLAYADKSYAAITYCILKQKQAIQDSIRSLLSWAKNMNFSYDELNTKVDELFQKGDLQKVSSDLLQLVCGHRAEAIEMRREAITSQIKEPLVKALVNKIPPSTTNIFDADSFTSALEKAGGVRKTFWPLKQNALSKANQPNSRPSRGQGIRKPTIPSRGIQCNATSGYFPSQNMHMQTCYNAPSRGVCHCQNCQQPNYPWVTQPSNNHPAYHTSGRGSFQNRGSRPDRGGTRGRGNAGRGYKGNQKRQKP
ncbi:uncharacterized protein LOC134805507 [Cydia splendana]|uniref:uncharacterized protein LOC134805507 n=1 Tax=Cydia splendana TaxID=1100963 RepID=UPI00300D7270